MESFGNALRAPKAQRKLLARQTGSGGPIPEPTGAVENPQADYNSMGSSIGSQAQARVQGQMHFGFGNTEEGGETGTNPGPVNLSPQDQQEEEGIRRRR